MPDRHLAFVHAQNIRDFKERLKDEASPSVRRLLERLLAEEATKARADRANRVRERTSSVLPSK